MFRRTEEVEEQQEEDGPSVLTGGFKYYFTNRI